VRDTRFWTSVGILFALHAMATLAATGARIGFYLFTIPIATPLIGGESLAGQLFWVLCIDAGLVFFGQGILAIAIAPEPSRKEMAVTGEPLDRLTRAGHLMLAAFIAAAAVALTVARDRVFVVGVMEPDAGGMFGTVVRPLFSASFAPYLPWVLAGAALDFVRHLVFAFDPSRTRRVGARALARTATASVLLLLATGSVFNISGLQQGLTDVGPGLELLAAFLLFVLAIASLAGGVKDWIVLVGESRA
jgi:hypothetical protein